MSLIGPHTPSFDCRREWSVARGRDTRVPVLTEDAIDISVLWRFISTGSKKKILSSFRLYLIPCTRRLIAVYFQFH
jgi:hypothetical protein